MSYKIASWLVERIRAAFPVHPVPRAEEVLYVGAYEGDPELEEIRKFFGNRPWTTITPKDVFHFRHALSFFSPRAFAYYAAAWMTCSVLDPDGVDTGITDLLFDLERVSPTLWREEQRRVICEWLAWMKDRDDLLPADRDDISAAAKNLGCECGNDSS